MINKRELVTQVAETAGTPKRTVKNILSALVATIHETMAEGGELTIPGIGKFSAVDRPARTGRNPQTGATVDIPARRAPKFKASKLLKQAAEKKAQQR